MLRAIIFSMKYILAPKNMHKDILTSIRSKDFFADVKLLTLGDLEDEIYPGILKDALPYLMIKKGWSYEEAHMLLRYIPYISSDSSNPKLHFLYELRQELEAQEYLHYDPTASFNIKEMDIFGYSKNDNSLKSVLEKLGIKPNFIEEKVEKTLEYRKFELLEEEVYFTLNEIAKLIKSGVDINNVYIVRRNNEYDYYLLKFAKYFNFALNIKNDDNYFSLGSTKTFLNFYRDNKDVEMSLSLLEEEMKDDERYIEIEDIVRDNIYEEFNFVQQYDYLVNIFKLEKLRHPMYDRAVNVVSGPIYGEGKYIFFMGFVQGKFPKSQKDTDYLNQDELKAINRLTNKDLTAIDLELLKSFIYSNENISFSYSTKSLHDNYYPSPLIGDLNMSKVSSELEGTFYSKELLSLIYIDSLDRKAFYKEITNNLLKIDGVVDVKYNSYDNQFKIKSPIMGENDYVNLSTSSLTAYKECPFKYYLSRVLKLEEFEENFAAKCGSFAHEAIQHRHDDNFNLDAFFAENLEQYAFNISEKFLMQEVIKSQLEVTIKAINLRERYMKNPKEFQELDLKVALNNNTFINGRIDSLIVLDNKYLVCIDYKSGTKTFDETKFEYGLSTQLPTYLLLASKDKNYQDLKTLGIFFNTIFPKNINNPIKEDDLIPDYLKLGGRMIQDLDAFSYLDSSISGGKSCYIKNAKISKEGGLTAGNSKLFVSEETFANYIDYCEKLFLQAAEDIRHNVFDIHPISFGALEACEYCSFRDICYLKQSTQVNEIKKEEVSDE